MMKSTGLLALVCLLVATASSQAARPAARILEARGEISIAGSDGEARPALVYGTVYADEELSGEPDSVVVLGFAGDGRIERIVSPRSVRITPRGCEPTGQPIALSSRVAGRKAGEWINKIPKPMDNGAITVLRSDDESVPRLTPLDESTLGIEPPTFSWPAVEGATRYQLSVKLGADPVWETTTTERTVKYDGPPFREGYSYNWQVSAATAENDAEHTFEASFTAPTAEQRAELEELRILAQSPVPALVALAAGRYLHHGFTDEAVATFERLADLMPEAAAVHATLSVLYDEAGRPDDAAKARVQARDLTARSAGAGNLR